MKSRNRIAVPNPLRLRRRLRTRFPAATLRGHDLLAVLEVYPVPVRCWARNWTVPSFESLWIGFRIVRGRKGKKV